jgi:hypothetical protein
MIAMFPEDSVERKAYPVYSGLLQYFPSALAAVAHHSHAGNDKHHPGQPLHHDRAKSDDEADALVRHLMEGDYTGMAWRALALLQKHLEAEGAAIAPAARNAQRTAAQVYAEQHAANIKQHRRVATPDELPPNLSNALRDIGIGDVPKRHPMQAEADRISPPESRL